MCEKVKTALDMAKQHKTLSKEDILVMFQQVALDLAKQGERMTEFEKRIESLEQKTDSGFARTDKVLAVVLERIGEIQKTLDSKKKPSFWERIPLLKEIPPLGWIFLIVSISLLAALFGVDLSFLSNWIKWGGQ